MKNGIVGDVSFGIAACCFVHALINRVLILMSVNCSSEKSFLSHTLVFWFYFSIPVSHRGVLSIIC